MSDVEITHEPLTYERAKPVSYFRDLVLARNGNLDAEKRLKAHETEMRTVMPAREAEREARARAAGVEFRVNPNTTDGTGGHFAVPVWLVDEFASQPRPARSLAKWMRNLPLPAGANQVSVPRFTTSNAVDVAEDGGAVPSQDIVDTASTQPVTPLAGSSDVAVQLLEQSPAGAHLDWVTFRDLTNSYDAKLEELIVNGSGSGQTFTGILNLPTGAGGVNAISYSDADPTAAEMAPFIAQAVAQVGNKRLAPPEVIAMRTARWAWIAISDNSLLAGDMKLLAFPVQPDDAIPTNVGGAGRDAIITMVASDSILLESTPRTEVMFEPLSGVLMARLRLHGYATAIHRQPTGIATVTGTGMAVQAGYS